MSVTDDVQHRSAHIHWPAAANPDQADLFAHNDIVISVPAEAIWDRLVRAADWPRWYSNAAGVTVNDAGGILAPGVTFDWVTCWPSSWSPPGSGCWTCRPGSPPGYGCCRRGTRTRTTRTTRCRWRSRRCAPQADSGDAPDQRASPDGQDSQRNFRLAFHKS